MKYLVIVESPAKIKPIEKYLGKDYQVKASFGHVRDLASKVGSVLPDEDFLMKYINTEKSAKPIKEIEQAVKKAEILYLATDPDREGEAIAWHVKEILEANGLIKNDKFVQRITFNEITKRAVIEAINNPREIDINLVNAQQARRALDYLVGFTLSPILWRKLPGCRSAGRVQSVALKLISEREDEIERFKSEEYWDITLNLLNSKNQPFTGMLSHANGEKLKKFSLTTEAQAEKLVKELKNQTFIIENLESKQQKRSPQPPFITSTMQQEAARKIGFTAKKTMQIAQKLYEGIEIDGEVIGLITYMRTDGVTLATEAVEEIRKTIKSKFSAQYLPAKARVYKSKLKNAQEAHEAIRPTNITIFPESLKDILDKDHYRLYDLIWKRTMACQMENVLINATSVDLQSQDKNFMARATGSIIIFDGFYKIYKEGVDDENEEKNNLLPELFKNELIHVVKIIPAQHFTEAPPKFSEASLIKTLEEKGIGRPSTLVSILSVLQERGYVSLVKKKFIPAEKGRLVTAFLTGFFKQYVEYDFTALLEEELDDVAAGNLDWKKLLHKFWDGFSKNVNTVGKLNIVEVISYVEQSLDFHLFGINEDNKNCPSCANGKLGLKLGKFGAFLGCNNYPECNFKKQITTNSNDDETTEPNIDNNKTLGLNSAGKEIFVKKGPYSWYIQEGALTTKEHKPKRVSLPASIKPEEATLEIATKLLSLPLFIGNFPESNDEIILGIGKFGPYIKYQEKFISIPKSIDPFTLSLGMAVTLIENWKITKKVDESEPSKKSSTKVTKKVVSIKKTKVIKTTDKVAAVKKAKVVKKVTKK